MKLAEIKNSTFKFEGAEFTIRELLSGDIAEIQDKAVDKKIELREIDGKLEQIQTFKDLSKIGNELAVIKSVVSWKNVNDKDDKELECNTQNKKRFCNELPDDVFKKFILKLNKERVKLSTAAKKQRESKKGN